jgi:1,3-beta-glucanosyltransferase GAS3
MKNYIAKRASRTIPVGYSAADVRDILADTWNYLQCEIDGKTDVSRSDFFGLNSYSWCGNATFESSGYNVLVDMFSSTTIPVFFSEYGCNKVLPRVFDEVLSLYGDQMTTLSGGLVYEYSQEVSDFGLVIINDNATISLRVDFNNLQTQYNHLNISLIESANGTATKLTPPKCASGLITNSAFNSSFNIPAVPSGVQDLINNGVSGISTGKFVDVTQTAMPVAVYDVNGQEVKGLVLNILQNDDTNVPGNAALNGTGSGGKKKNAGSTSYQVAPGAMILLGLVAVFML